MVTLAPPKIPVLILVNSLGPGGTERQSAEMAKALHQDMVFSPHVASFDPQGMRADELRAAGIPILSLPLNSLLNKSAVDSYCLLKAYVRKHNIKLFHAFDAPSTVFGVPAARMIGVPVVLSSQRSYRRLTFRKHLPLLRLADKLGQGIVVNCHAIEDHLIAEYSIPRTRIRVCHNGIDTARFTADNRTRPESLRDASLVIGTLSQLRPEKDIGCLLRAFAILRPDYPGLRLAIVGSGPEKPGLQRLAHDLNISPACIWEESTNDVSRWFHAIDIFVLASVSEALSNALMEAMTCGCCAVASNVGGNPELVHPDETGLLFEKQDAPGLAAQLRLLVENPQLRERLAQAGTALIRRDFSLAAASRTFHEIYTGFLQARGLFTS